MIISTDQKNKGLDGPDHLRLPSVSAIVACQSRVFPQQPSII